MEQIKVLLDVGSGRSLADVGWRFVPDRDGQSQESAHLLSVVNPPESLFGNASMKSVDLMNSEEKIRKLSLRVTAAPEGSEVFRVATDELRTGLKDRAERGRKKIKAMKSTLARSDD